MGRQIFDGIYGRNRRSVRVFISFSFIVLWSLASYAVEETPDGFSAEPGCYKYEIDCNPYRIIEDELKPNQTLSQILLAHNLSAAKIHQVARESKPIFDVRKMKVGHPYTVMVQSDADNTARYFIYEKNPTQFVVYDLSDPIGVYEGRKKVERRTRMAAGTVEYSLVDSLAETGLEGDLTTPLAEIYSWTLDFHHLKKGDRYVIIFEENYLENQPIGVNKVVAVRFDHGDHAYYAFCSNRNGREEYYDQNGQSLQRSFLKAPLRYTRITSRPSTRRLHPILKIHRAHLGTDYAAPQGTPIMTVGDGVVKKAGYHKELGNHLVIQHNRIYKSQYLHLSKFAEGIRQGVRVSRGDVIGYVGSTGLATGPHLDFRFWKNGKISSLVDANGSEVESLAGEALQSYKSRIAELKANLDIAPLPEKTFTADYPLLQVGDQHVRDFR